MKVITYQSPSGETIDLTLKQVTEFTISGQWPKDSKGDEYCTVSHGLHEVSNEQPVNIIP
jgi:hypothetical protein